MYTLDTIQELLLAEHLIDKNNLLFDDFETTSINRRNRNIQVTTRLEPNYLIKQVADLTADNAKTLKKEILFYNFFKESFINLKDYLPVLRYSNINELTLIIDFYKNAIPLWKYYQQKGIHNFPLKTVGTIGNLLAEIHHHFSDQNVINHSKADFLSDDLPFIFKLHQPHPNKLAHLAKGGLDFIEHLQAQSDIILMLNKIEETWEKNAIIHGDIKLDNFILLNPEKEESTEVKLVDWEMSQIGDIAWDIAGCFNDFIFWWVITMPDNKTPDEMIKGTKFPFQKLYPAIEIFWINYCKTASLTEEKTETLLEKALHYAGFRILQTSYEVASKFDTIPSIANVLLKMSESIIRSSHSSRKKLFGLTNTILVS